MKRLNIDSSDSIHSNNLPHVRSHESVPPLRVSVVSTTNNLNDYLSRRPTRVNSEIDSDQDTTSQITKSIEREKAKPKINKHPLAN
jgi:hypothetical protein